MRPNFFIPLILAGFVMPFFSMANPAMLSSSYIQNQLQSGQSSKGAYARPCSLSAEAAAPGPSGPLSEEQAGPSSFAPPSEEQAAPSPSGPPNEEQADPLSEESTGPSAPLNENESAPAPNGGNMAPAQATQGGASQTMTDAESLCIVRQINTNEIALAKQMLIWLHHKNTEPMKSAKKLALRIIEDHNIINASLDAVVKKTNITPATVITSKSCADMMSAGDSLMKKLQGYQGAGLARQFIDDMRQGHSEGQVLMQNLADKASNPEINKFLLETQGLIHAHASIATDDQEKANK